MITHMIPSKINKRASTNDNVRGSFKMSEEEITPHNGTPNRPSDVVIGGSSLLITTPPQYPKAVAMTPLYKSAIINVWFQTI